jgi:hypothetical protein
MFCARGLFLGGTEVVGVHFQDLRSQTHFWRYRGRRVPFSCFAVPDSFSIVSRSSRPDFMFCAPGFVSGDTEGVGSHFHVLRTRTNFRRYQGRLGSFSCFALLDTFWAILRASGPVFMLCAPELVSGGTEGVSYRFQVLLTRNRFRRYLGRRGSFSCFALPDSFWAVPRAPSPVFMFRAPGFVSEGTEGIGYRFQVLRSRTHFRRYLGRRGSFSSFAHPDSFWQYRGRRVPFSRFALPDSFPAVPRASGPAFLFSTL